MSQQHLNYGTTADDGTGDTLRSAASKIEANFNELYPRRGEPFSPPLASAFSLIGTVTPTLTDSDTYGLIMDFGASVTGDVQRGAMKSIPSPSAAWNVITRINPTLAEANWNAVGLLMSETTSGKYIFFGVEAATDALTYRISRLNGLSGFNTNPLDKTIHGMIYTWLKIAFDGTNIVYSLSSNGTTWLDILSEAANAFFTTRPDKVGLGGTFNYTNSIHAQMTVPYWSQSF